MRRRTSNLASSELRGHGGQDLVADVTAKEPDELVFLNLPHLQKRKINCVIILKVSGLLLPCCCSHDKGDLKSKQCILRIIKLFAVAQRVANSAYFPDDSLYTT